MPGQVSVSILTQIAFESQVPAKVGEGGHKSEQLTKS